MKIAITGASGFIGRKLSAYLTARGHSVTAISLRGPLPPNTFAGCDAVIHLSGEPVAQRWSPSARKRIMESRVQGTRAVVSALEAVDPKPRVLISASAVGIYGGRSGMRGDEKLSEMATPATDFLGQVATAWEREARAAEDLGIRVVCPRIGVVIGRSVEGKPGGALERMLLPFRLGVGGRLSSGRQWMSWIHIDDLCALIAFALDHHTINGPVNATAPIPVTNAEFTRELARALHRPALFPVPAIALQILFGDMAQILLEGQRVVPTVALAAGFTFQFKDIASALRDVLPA